MGGIQIILFIIKFHNYFRVKLVENFHENHNTHFDVCNDTLGGSQWEHCICNFNNKEAIDIKELTTSTQTTETFPCGRSEKLLHTYFF